MKIEVHGQGTNPYPESWYLEMFEDAKAQVLSFFKLYGIAGNLENIEKMTIFTREGMLRDYCCEIFSVSPNHLPIHLAAGIHENELFILTPNLYRECCFEPQCSMLTHWEVHHYGKLIAHELAHRIHEYYCLEKFNTAEAMGPIWFFEGLACFAARQFYFLYEDYKREAQQLIRRIESVDSIMDTDFQYAEFYKVVEGLDRFLSLKEILAMDWSKESLQAYVLQKLQSVDH